jgi:carotenoid cleavage dioxygenase-like enzyme
MRGVFDDQEVWLVVADHGVMDFIHNPDRGAADLVLLAAQDFTAEPIARVHLPIPTPLGFHGSWVPDQ